KPNRNIVIRGNICHDNARKCIDVHSGEYILISDNLITGTGLMGISVSSENRRKQAKCVTITNNIVDGGELAQGAGIYVLFDPVEHEESLPSMESVTISNNIVQNIKNPSLVDP